MLRDGLVEAADKGSEENQGNDSDEEHEENPHGKVFPVDSFPLVDDFKGRHRGMIGVKPGNPRSVFGAKIDPFDVELIVGEDDGELLERLAFGSVKDDRPGQNELVVRKSQRQLDVLAWIHRFS